MPPEPASTPLAAPRRIALAYAAFAGAWILLSDRALDLLFADGRLLGTLQTYKGGAFVALTSLLLYLALARDATRRHAAEAGLADSEERYRRLLDGVQEYAIYLLDQQGRVASWNRGAERVKGYCAEEILGRDFACFFPAEALAAGVPAARLAQAARDGQCADEDWRLRRDGGRFWASTVITALRDGRGAPAGYSVITRDITEQRLAARRLAEQEERFRVTFEQAAVGIAHVAPDGRWLRVNERLCAIVGYSREELLARRFQDLTHPDDLAADVAMLQRLLGGEATTYVREKRYLHRDGSVVWIELTVALCRGADGTPKFFVTVLQDISARKRIEAQAQAQLTMLEALYSGAAQLTGNLEVQALADGTARFCVERLGARLAWIGRAEPDGSLRLLTSAPAEFDYPRRIEVRWDDSSLGAGPTGIAIRSGRAQVVDDLGTAAAGRFSPWHALAQAAGLRTSAALPLIHRGEPFGALNLYAGEAGFFTPMRIELFQALANQLAGALAGATLYARLREQAGALERRVAERTAELAAANAALTQQAEQLADLYDRAPCGYHSLDAAGRYLRVNQTELDWLGYPREALLGQSFRALLGEASQRLFDESFACLKRTGRFSDLDLELRRADGTLLPVALSATAVIDAEGRFVATRSTVFDVTERKRAEALVRRLNAELAERAEVTEAANRELEAFTYTVSHDLRAPLRAMQGLSQALLEDYGPVLDATGREYAQRVLAAAERMDRLIQDLLVYSRLGWRELACTDLELAAVLAEARAQVLADPARRGAVVELVEPLPAVHANASLLRQVFVNLLENACKFVAPGARAAVRVWAERRDGRLRVWVEDAGIGIAPEHHERIFRVFERLHGIEQYPGTGIGLAIVRKAVERMGGSVGLASAPGAGSRFWVELPAPG
ncbi:PAS domain S-box-containing protein [Plasticicumulans lactativorans]|uniref:histidine kinase n=1 Tax=Plasticicumulans lactativorans TaxID=1133106 RepID=A0A4R2L9F6_9GAMM|nr:PAS domain S-box protein [Plasticicumulans lactativorans]TCO83789.1 PAS domain S-box-containing protein [Plasticicumulans lactativorans]